MEAVFRSLYSGGTEGRLYMRHKAPKVRQERAGMRETYGNSGGNSKAILSNSGAFTAIRARRGRQNVGAAAIRSPGSKPL